MQDLLFLAHRIPYPPNKGDKLRSYHLLKHLSRQFNIHLGCFIDDPEDWQHTNHLQSLCADTFFAPLSRGRGMMRSVMSLLNDEPFTTAYFRDRGMSDWVLDVARKKTIRHVVAFSSAMGQYAEDLVDAVKIVDMVDVDSAKWDQLARMKPWPASWLYRRESKKLLAYEVHAARHFDATVFVSAAEMDLFKRLAGEQGLNICYASNGVDTAYFSPDHAFENPFSGTPHAIVFTGAMDYWPNVDAVTWFATEIFPRIRAQWSDAIFAVVGARPTPEVTRLQSVNGITVTGSVPDVRPYIRHAAVVVAPLRIARGVQNKVLEGMAMAKTVVASAAAAEGIDGVPGKDFMVANGKQDYVELIGQAFRGALNLGAPARARVIASYSWEANLQKISGLLLADPLESRESNASCTATH